MLDSVVPDHTGLLFDEQSEAGLIDAVRRFEAMEGTFHPEIIRQHAQQFSDTHFRQRMQQIIDDEIARRKPMPVSLSQTVRRQSSLRPRVAR